MKTRVFFFIICILLVSCQNAKRHDEKSVDIQSFQINPAHFLLEHHPGFTRLVIYNPWQDSQEQAFCYYLFPTGAAVPDSIPVKSVIRVPVKRIICMSTTHIAMLKALQAEDNIAGISGTDLVYDRSIRKKIEAGNIPDVGYESNLDKELIISLKPDLLIAYGVEASSAEYLRKLGELGVQTMYDADYLEKHPLARCEWIRVFGALLCREELADSIYRNVTENYLKLLDSISHFPKSYPRVLLGFPWEDTWYMPPANSYVVRLITDAGGSYLFSDLEAPYAKPYSIEAVFERAMKANIWLNPGYSVSLSEIEASDYRMAQLPVFKSGEIYNNNNRSDKGGGNDYWESAIIHPDLLLRDLANIFHPGFMPDSSLVYYKKLK